MENPPSAMSNACFETTDDILEIAIIQKILESTVS